MQYINEAVKQMKQEDDLRMACMSDLAETEPYGYTEQDKFINGCIGIDTLKTPEELLGYLQRLENNAGRERLVHWGPRTLDLDILLYDDIVIHGEHLTIPHTEIAPYERHPVLNKTILELKDALEEKEEK